MQTVTVSEKCQVVIPIEIRRRLGIAPGCQLDFILEGTTLRMEVKRRIKPSSHSEDGYGQLVRQQQEQRRLSDFDVAQAMREQHLKHCQQIPRLLHAEVEAHPTQAPTTPSTPYDLEELLYELQVLQLELELQNEELRRTHAALEASRDSYFDLYEFAPIGYLTISAEDMIAEINLTGARLLGLERKQLIHRRFGQFVADQDKDRWHCLFMSIMGDAEEEKQCFDLKLNRSNGSMIHARFHCLRKTGVSVSPVLRMAFTDITQLNQAEADLRAAASAFDLEHRFRQAVESAPNANVMVNESGTILMVNSQTEISFGYSFTELLGQPVEMLMPERFRGGHTGFRNAYCAAPQSRPMGVGLDIFGLRKDGSEFPVDISLSIIDSHEGILVMSTIVDITQRKRANDKLKEALNEKEIMLKEIFHRVKNNLQVVSSLINLQARNVKNEAVANLLKQSTDRIKSMALIHENLYQSKDLANINFASYIHDLVDHLLLSHGVSSSKVNVSMGIDDVCLDVDTAIPCGLLINELLSNALVHAFPDDRQGKIGITFTQDQGEFILVITDNGIGFPLDLDYKTSASLGLQLVVMLTNQLMGHMSLDQSAGTTFRIRFTTTYS